ncbi:hypothetical protein GGR58DRAFT_138895 [Xylaria digitata]|nr:hypothetical protein GGR58DRAFT_138895 [Xylaria digitata]
MIVAECTYICQYLGRKQYFKQDSFSSYIFEATLISSRVERWVHCFGLHEHPLLKPLGLTVPPEERKHEHPCRIDMGGAGVFDLKIARDYLAFNIAYERVRLLKDATTGWDGLEYFRCYVYLLDTVDEV